jgi:diguanylate cyclase (GGDEF)-like protein
MSSEELKDTPGRRARALLYGDSFDRDSILDMETRVRPVRMRVFVILAAALAAMGPWLGWWPLILLASAAACFAIADLILERVSRPDYLMFGAWVASSCTIGVGVALTGGVGIATACWLALPMITLGSRFPTRGVLAGVALNVAILLVVAFTVDADAVLKNPVLVIAPLALIVSAATLSTPLMSSDIRDRRDAVIDQLTGMLNRKALATRALELAQQSCLTGEPVGLILADLDHFRAVNESRGQAVGDMVLTEVAHSLRKQLRAFDLLYRLGEEDFLVLLPGSDLLSATTVAEKLRAEIAAERFAGGVSVTMSFGVGASQAGESFSYDAVFAMADEALYRAKHGGRDRVCHAPADETSEASLGVPVFA